MPRYTETPLQAQDDPAWEEVVWELRALADRLSQAGQSRSDDPSPFLLASKRREDLAISLNAVECVIQSRKVRNRLFGSELFGDPVWDMLLDLFSARLAGRRESVTSVCLASDAPMSTALRYLSVMIDAGLGDRFEDPGDRRRTIVALSDDGYRKMGLFFAEYQEMTARAA